MRGHCPAVCFSAYEILQKLEFLLAGFEKGSLDVAL